MSDHCVVAKPVATRPSVFAYTDSAETEGGTTTTAAAFVNALTLGFTTPAAGTYLIRWYYEAKHSTVNAINRSRVQLNAVDQAFNDVPITDINADLPISGFREVVLGAGAQTLTIDFYPFTGVTAQVRRRRLYVMRVA